MIDPEITFEALAHVEKIVMALTQRAHYPLYYRCNEKTWAELKRITPTRIALLTDVLAGVEIRVYPDLEDGFHPIYKTAIQENKP